MGNYEENREIGYKRKKPGRGVRNIAPVGLRQLPRTSVDICGMRGRQKGTRDGKYGEKRRAKLGIGGRIKGGVGEISIRSASAGVRGRPRHVWAGNGRWAMRNNEGTGENRNIWQMPGRDWLNIASVSLRLLLRWSIEIRDMRWRKTEDGGKK